MIKIRLSRQGRKNKPCYQLVVSDSKSPRDSNFIEKLGTYDPLLNKANQNRIVLEKERVEYWISVGAKTSGAADRLLKHYQKQRVK